MHVRRLWEQVEGLSADLAAENEERIRLRRALTKQGKQLTEIVSLLSHASDERKVMLAQLEAVRSEGARCGEAVQAVLDDVLARRLIPGLGTSLGPSAGEARLVRFVRVMCDP